MSHTLPPMFVEEREPTTAHGLNPPSLPGSDAFEDQLHDTLVLVESAKKVQAYPTELLDKYLPFDRQGIEYNTALKTFGFRSWRECVLFVEDDECNEFFVRVAHWAKDAGFAERAVDGLEGFIDGSGLGIQEYYLEVAREILEKGFDAKWFFYRELGTKRPLEHFLDRLGFICEALFCYIHPGHPRYPAGHSCKFFAAVVAAVRLWGIPERQRLILLIAAYVLSMARTGGGVHLPEDNLGGGYLAGLPEFEEFGQ